MCETRKKDIADRKGTAISNVIQKLVFDKASAQNFDQAEPVKKQAPVIEIGACFCRSKLWDDGAVKNQLLNHLGYIGVPLERHPRFLF